ncbi:MAG: chemotaxis-specific protein-glutamate methyltransferase CheB [Acidobacteriota bacterium]
MIKVLVVDDSPVMREFLVGLLRADPEIEVVSTAGDGEQAVQMALHHRPHVITMDINMPNMNGFEATRKIMETVPTPIVIVTGSVDPKAVATTFQAMEAGALMVLPRPQGPGHPDHAAMARELVLNVKLMSEVKVVRRSPRARAQPTAPPPKIERATPQVQVVALGASTGGPIVIHTIISKLPRNFPLPLLIVQHMAPGFISGFAQWLSESTQVPVHVARDGELMLPGHAYLAPDSFQMGVGLGYRIRLADDEAENGLRPSVSYLFRSVSDAFGPDAAGVLLTGMGRDGAAELKLMRDRGAVTFAQDESSSVVHGMPGEAIRLGAAARVLPPEKIAEEIALLAQNKQR